MKPKHIKSDAANSKAQNSSQITEKTIKKSKDKGSNKRKKARNKLKRGIVANDDTNQSANRKQLVVQNQPGSDVEKKTGSIGNTSVTSDIGKAGPGRRHRYERLFQKRKENRINKKKPENINDSSKSMDGIETESKSTSMVSKTTKDIKLPCSEDIDANWKLLMKTIEKPAKKRYPKKVMTSDKADVEIQKKEDVEKKKDGPPEVWFDDVDEILLERPVQMDQPTTDDPSDVKTIINPLVKPESFQGITKVIAMDCEMVGVGEDGKDSILARCSIVNQFGQELYDKYVAPTETVTDYRTFVSGIRPEHIKDAEKFSVVCKEVSDILKDRILVGHAVHHDMAVLFLDHPFKQIRDTSTYKPFKQLFQNRTPSLKKLTEKLLGVAVQTGQHDSVEDARATMRLFTMHRQAWEKSIRQKKKERHTSKKNKKKSVTVT